MTYLDSVRYLYGLGNELRPGAKFGLEQFRLLLQELGDPQREQRFVHVAGTNGKGSTCAIIASALRQAGIRTGLYTSPHLTEPTERIQIDGSAITDEEFAAAFRTVHAAADRLLERDRLDAHPSYFETVTAMGFLVFRERSDITVLEVGLGGRLDATNVVTPELCVLTPIAYDHEVFLGSTLEAIAFEKAGILKPGVPAVVAPQPPHAARVIDDRAAQLGCKLVPTPEPSDVRVSPSGSEFSLAGVRYECSLPGRHQIENAITAIATCRELNVESDAIRAGLKNVQWPGRLELVSRNPDLVLDGAHNPAGADALAAYIREFCSLRPVWIVYGAMRDKAIEEVTSSLFPLADHVIATAPQFARAVRPETILDAHYHPNAWVASNVREAIELARAAPRRAIVFFTGSLYLVGEARGILLGTKPRSS